MNNQRIVELSNEVYDFIFNLLDNEPEISGYEAGKIGSEIQQRFIDEVYCYVERPDQ